MNSVYKGTSNMATPTTGMPGDAANMGQPGAGVVTASSAMPSTMMNNGTMVQSNLNATTVMMAMPSTGMPGNAASMGQPGTGAVTAVASTTVGAAGNPSSM